MSDPMLHPTDTALFKKAWKYLRPELPLYVLAMLAAPASALLVVLQPYLLRIAIDDYIQVGDVAGVQGIALGYLGAVLVAFVMEATYTLAMSYGALRSIARLRGAVYTHTLSLSRSFFDKRRTGQLLTRATSDVDALGETLTAGAVTIVLDVLLVVGILAAMLWQNAALTFVILLMAPVIAVVLETIRRILRRLYLEVRESLSALNAYIAERLSGVQVVQLYSDEERSMTQFGERVTRYRNATIATNVWDATLYAIVDGLTSVSVALMLWYGTGSLLEGALSAGLLAAFVDYVDKLFRPIREFSAKIAILQRASAALEKIFGLLDNDDRITAGSRSLPENADGFSLEDVTFAYGEEGPTVLSHVDIEVGAGQVVALVGRTGSGKSTLAKLLTRAYDGYEGSLKLGGIELSELHPAQVRSAVSTVEQDVRLFPGDVRFNLSLGADRTDAELLEAVRLVHAEGVVERLGGLDGLITHDGANISVGEAQLLSFARTMAAKTPIVLLDEATASVDTLTEALIQEATNAVFAHRTVLVIAHRLSTIVNADQIIVLDAGQVIERGTHRELLAADGAYADLFHSQFGEDGNHNSPSTDPA
ncbi:MAG: ABC transporter ATP-binding protein [Proteobacteria bacterium]|nr:ABC transporter ATP-binding protein [Pseudomonadota bacterium]